VVQLQVVQALNNLLQDEFHDIRQFAVIACSRFVQVSDEYKVSLSEMSAVHALLGLVIPSANTESFSHCIHGEPLHAYETAHVCRQACRTLIAMIQVASDHIRHIFETFGISDMQTLKERCNTQVVGDCLIAELELCFI
jgi:hypothetical protein